MRSPTRQLSEQLRNLKAPIFFFLLLFTQDNALKLFKIKSKSLNRETLFTASGKLLFFRRGTEHFVCY